MSALEAAPEPLAPDPAAVRPRRFWRGLGVGLLALAMAVLLGERLWLAVERPLWLDETWTQAIVSAPGGGFWREVYLDVNAPLYYVLMRGWTALFGLGDLSLRLPGLILAPLAAVLVWRGGWSGLSPRLRAMWGVLIFFWWGVGQFLDGRCYGLLLCFSVLLTLSFARLLRRPSLATGALWGALAALTVLTHYYALFIVAGQGLVLLGRWRLRAFKAWPAAVAFVPALAWMAYHAPRVAQYGRPDVAWHPPLSLDDALGVIGFSFAAYAPYLAIGAAVALIAFTLSSRLNPAAVAPTAAEPVDTAAWVTAAGLIALALALASAALRPTLSPRYLIPLVPSILLGVSLWAQALRRAPAVPAALMAAYVVFGLNPVALAQASRLGAPYGFEAGSRFLAAGGVTDLTYVWDHPAAKIMDPGSLQRIGAAYFQRAGLKVAVHPLVAAQSDDPNRLLPAAAQGARPGLLWIYDREGRTAAHDHAPRIAQLDPRWTCRTFGDGQTGSMACLRAKP